MTTPETQTDRFKQQIEAEWTDPALIDAYRKWGRHEAETFKPATEFIVRTADGEPGMHVLDLASGSGEPALAFAREVGPNGRVTATDLASELLVIAANYAREQGIANVDFRQADAHDLPFPAESFDRVTARFGVMYFADDVQAFRECLRVLKQGGKPRCPGPFHVFRADMGCTIFVRVWPASTQSCSTWSYERIRR